MSLCPRFPQHLGNVSSINFLRVSRNKISKFQSVIIKNEDLGAKSLYIYSVYNIIQTFTSTFLCTKLEAFVLKVFVSRLLKGSSVVFEYLVKTVRQSYYAPEAWIDLRFFCIYFIYFYSKILVIFEIDQFLCAIIIYFLKLFLILFFENELQGNQ